jgi:hypothetical protein
MRHRVLRRRAKRAREGDPHVAKRVLLIPEQQDFVAIDLPGQVESRLVACCGGARRSGLRLVLAPVGPVQPQRQSADEQTRDRPPARPGSATVGASVRCSDVSVIGRPPPAVAGRDHLPARGDPVRHSVPIDIVAVQRIAIQPDGPR